MKALARVAAWVGAWVAASCVAGSVLAQPPEPKLELSKPGEFKVAQKDADWRDDARKRDVPVRVYLPQRKEGGKDKGPGETPGLHGAGEKFPLIVFSHGMGASRTSYGYICEHLASHGFVVISPTHEGATRRACGRRWGTGCGTGSKGMRSPGRG